MREWLGQMGCEKQERGKSGREKYTIRVRGSERALSQGTSDDV